MILFAGAIVVIAAMCVLSIDVGYLLACRAQLQNAVDAAALAGASQLTGYMEEGERELVIAEAQALAAANSVAGLPLTLTEQDIEFGHYDADAGTFTPESEASVIDSIRVAGRRTVDSPEGPVELFFGPLFGWDHLEFADVKAIGSKPRRHVMFVLDRSGSMCFDTSGVQLETYLAPQDAHGPYFQTSSSGWYWFPELALKRTGYGWRARTAWFWARDDATGDVCTDWLPEHIQDHLEANRYFNFRPRDYPTSVMSGWLKVPAGVTVYGRWGSPWHYWLASSYYHVISSQCGYARSVGAVQPLQDTVDAACAFVDLLDASDDRAGLITYGWNASADQLLTSDFDRLKLKLYALSPCGATAEPEGMEAANDEFIDSGRAEGYGHKTMILLTDGYANMLHGNSYSASSSRNYTFLGEQVTTNVHPTVGQAMAQATTRARSAGVRIYSVTFGSDVDTELHRRMAVYTNGAYYHAEQHEELTDIFMDIFRRLPPVLTQ